MRAAPARRSQALALALAASSAWLVLMGCGAALQPANETWATRPVDANADVDSASAPSVPPGAPSAAPVSASTPTANAPARTARVPEIVLDAKQPMRPLPELKVANIGLHVGGGPNDPDTKAPFQRAIAERFPEFLDCYRKNEDPAKGGRFGIDLHIARAGGHPRVEQPRTAMHGPDFRACLRSVFESVEFPKPTRGPTTISYSLHFSVGEPP
jgi:hypothetical protein